MKTSVAQIMVVGGRSYDAASNVLVHERITRGAPWARVQAHDRSGRDYANLYVLVELPGQPRFGQDSSLASHLAGVVHQAFYGRSGSVTAGLQQAVREANRLLYEENRNALPGERQTAGLSVAVLRGDDLFLAQAGPAAVYVGHEDQVMRFPDVSPWLDNIPPEEQDAAPLGDRSDTNVALFHVQVEPGDTLLMVDTSTARCLDPSDWTGILDAGRSSGCKAVLDALLTAAPQCDLSAVALTLGDGPAPAFDEPVVPLNSTPATAAPAGPALSERLAALVAGLGLGARLTALARTLRSILATLGFALLTLLRRLVPGSIVSTHSAEVAAPRAGRVARSASRAPAAARSTRPVSPLPRRATSDPVHKLLILMAISVPLIVALIVGIKLTMRATDRQAEMDVLWQQAESSWQQANAATDPAAARTALLAAQAALDTIRQRQPDRPGASELRSQVMDRLDEMGKIERFGALTELVAYPAGADLARVVVQGQHVFVLDRKGGRVYHHQLDSGQQALTADSRATVLVSRGQQVGSIVVGDLVDMVWMGVDAANVRARPALVIQESGGKLLEYDPATGELGALEVGGRDVVKFPKWVGSNAGRLYLIDSGANKIWRYDPTPDGYSGAPDDWLKTAIDLSGVVDATVGDGIYLLYADSHIQKLMLGETAPFQTTDWDIPPRGPRAVATYPADDTESVYLADTGNSRIMQTATGGNFVRQYRLAEGQPDVLQGITSLYFDGTVGRAFFTSGSRLYLATLPE